MVARLIRLGRRTIDGNARGAAGSGPDSRPGTGSAGGSSAESSRLGSNSPSSTESRTHESRADLSPDDPSTTQRSATDSKLTDSEVELLGHELHIGESSSGEIVVGDAASVSNTRAILVRVERRWVVRSAVGHQVRVNGKTTSEAPLRRDDVLELGDGSASFTFRDEEGPTSHDSESTYESSYDALDRVVRFVEQSGQLPHVDQLLRYAEQFLMTTSRADAFQLLKADGSSPNGETVRGHVRAAVQRARSEQRAILEVAADGSSFVCVPNFSASSPFCIYLGRHHPPALTDSDRRVASACARLLPYLRHQIGVRDTLFEELQSLRNEAHRPVDLCNGGAAFQHALERARHVANGNAPVLIHGEDGVGKQVIARYLHSVSPRVGGPIVAIDCSLATARAAREYLGEADRSDAAETRTQGTIGKWRRAHGGTLYLSHVSELPLALQEELLALIDRNELRPVAAEAPPQSRRPRGRVDEPRSVGCGRARTLQPRALQTPLPRTDFGAATA